METTEYRIPAVALRGMVVLPEMVTHFDVSRSRSIKAVEQALSQKQNLFVVTQQDPDTDAPEQEDLFTYGTVVEIKQIVKMPHNILRVLVEGMFRARLVELETGEYLNAQVEESEPEDFGDLPLIGKEAMLRNLKEIFQTYCEGASRNSKELVRQVLDSRTLEDMITQVMVHAPFDWEKQQRLLEAQSLSACYEMLCITLNNEIEIERYRRSVQEKVKARVDKQQKEYYLREQMKVIRTELGEEDEEEEAMAYRSKIQALHLDQEVEEKLLKDVNRMAKQPFGSAEGAVLRNYLDAVLELPWNKRTRERVDIQVARKILDEDHFGLEKVKERILEVLAVKQMAPELPSQIICLVGPPGVGKTSIAYSIARCLNRNMARISLGGVHDEAEIRGHRKTYVGAMPGRIMTALTQAGSRNALLLLDEVDKMGSDYRGDPSSALLEVLDGEQNGTYRDHYMEVPFDLSECMFITTANTTDTIPRPLLDRMEVIELGSYTDEEKRMIAKNHLLPKQMKKHGLRKSQLRITDDALGEIITCYTRESGVRNLERRLGALCRKADMRLVEENGPKRITVSGSNLEEFLGVRRYLPDRLPPADPVGLVTGLAWTSVGGETLEVEVNVMEGSGKLELTGNLGDVMKESAHAALSYIRSRAEVLGIPSDFYKNRDIHVHFPEGAIPKDGPSAGVTVCTAMVSALTGTPVRRDIAMTGEISIRGRVLPIGGLKEKTMAALRHGVQTVVIPQANQRDLEEIDQTVRKSLNFITAEHVDTVLEAALLLEPPVRDRLKLDEARPIALEGKKTGRKPAIRQ